MYSTILCCWKLWKSWKSFADRFTIWIWRQKKAQSVKPLCSLIFSVFCSPHVLEWAATVKKQLIIIISLKHNCINQNTASKCNVYLLWQQIGLNSITSSTEAEFTDVSLQSEPSDDLSSKQRQDICVDVLTRSGWCQRSTYLAVCWWALRSWGAHWRERGCRMHPGWRSTSWRDGCGQKQGQQFNFMFFFC